jgi:NADH-quinone oxidoreductase subunit F
MSNLIKALKKYGVSVGKSEGELILLGTFIAAAPKAAIALSPIECDAGEYIKYEAGSEAGVLALIAKCLIGGGEYIDELDEGYLSAESNVGEEEAESVANLIKDGATLVLGGDLDEHPDIDTVAGLIALITRHSSLKVGLISGETFESAPSDELPQEIDELPSFDGTVVYIDTSCDERFEGSAQFAIAAKIKDGDTVKIRLKNGEYERKFHTSTALKGTIALLGIKAHQGWRYEIARITRGQ